MLSQKTTVVAIVGPTCTGKTDLSIELAQMLNGEIIALDSRTIYKKMNIGTAKPTATQQNIIKHYALDLIEPDRFFTLAEYVKIAKDDIDKVISKGKLPILCGGTGLYARALLEGIQIPAIAPQPGLRKELNEFADKEGNEKLHAKLFAVDPDSALRLNINDRRRIIRALEVFLLSGKPFSQMALKVDLPFNTHWIGLNWVNRDVHKKIIAHRLEKHLQDGLIEEVQYLWQNENYQAVINNSVNYKEFIPYLNKNASLDAVQSECIKNNFQLARKQMIWFRARPFINWILLEEDYALKEITNKAKKMLPDYLFSN